LKLGEFSRLKLGRQPLSYDDQRILGGLGWAQQARTHDAAVYKYKKNTFSLDIGGALNTTTDEVYNVSSLFSYRDMMFLRANTKGEKLNFTFLGMVNTNLYLQEGERLGGVDVKGALLASILAKLKVSDKLTLGAGYESISGRTDDSAAFFPLYGTNHAFNGLIDRFYVGNHGNAGGLNDLQVSLATKISGCVKATQNWAWAMLIIKPKFLNTAK